MQDIVSFPGLCVRINTILYARTLCLGTSPRPIIAHTIAQYNVPPRPPVTAIYRTQYWQWQYRVKAKLGLESWRGEAESPPADNEDGVEFKFEFEINP